MKLPIVNSKKTDFEYCSCFCEENCYKMIERMVASDTYNNDEIFVIFVSSISKATPIWHQLSAAIGEPVFWDYHVIIRCGSYIFDLDSSLPFPSPAQDYVNFAFRPELSIPPQHAQLFRIVPAFHFLARFSSDRSHMAGSGKPFPHWPQICGPNAASSHELFSFLDLKEMVGVEELLGTFPSPG